jgi:hypothetical protein
LKFQELNPLAVVVAGGGAQQITCLGELFNLPPSSSFFFHFLVFWGGLKSNSSAKNKKKRSIVLELREKLCTRSLKIKTMSFLNRRNAKRTLILVSGHPVGSCD